MGHAYDPLQLPSMLYVHVTENRIWCEVPHLVLLALKKKPNPQTQENLACGKQEQDLNTISLYCSLKSRGKLEQADLFSVI